jgi:hypothetical protein
LGFRNDLIPQKYFSLYVYSMPLGPGRLRGYSVAQLGLDSQGLTLKSPEKKMAVLPSGALVFQILASHKID